MEDDIVVGQTGEVYIAPVGTPAPTTSASALDAAWKRLGLIDPNGAKVADGKTIVDIMSWQRFYASRKILTGKTFDLTFALQNWIGASVKFAFGGGTVASLGAGEYHYTPPAAGVIDDRALVLHAVDGGFRYRWHLPRGLVSDNVEATFDRADAALLPIVFSVIGVEDEDPWEIFTNNPAFMEDGAD